MDTEECEPIQPNEVVVFCLLKSYLSLAVEHHNKKVNFTISEKQQQSFAKLALKILLSRAVEFKFMYDSVGELDFPELEEKFKNELNHVTDGDHAAMFELFQGIMLLVSSSLSIGTVVTSKSVCGLFLRRLCCRFQLMSFERVMQLHHQCKEYVSKNLGLIEREENTIMSLDELNNNTNSSNGSPADPSYLPNDEDVVVVQSDECGVSLPLEVMAGSGKSGVAFVHFLKAVRDGDFPATIERLCHYFDLLMGEYESPEAALDATPGISVIIPETFSYMPLVLGSIFYRFHHVEKCRVAVQEAIALAVYKSNPTALQHALGWLCRLVEELSPQASFLLHKALATCQRLELRSLAHQARVSLARHLAMNGGQPSEVLSLLAPSPEPHQHALAPSQHISVFVDAAALWYCYGSSRLSLLFSQMVLHSHAPPKGVSVYSQSHCIALSLLARNLADRGEFDSADEILRFCEEHFPVKSHAAPAWLLVQQEITTWRALLRGRLEEAEQAARRIMILDRQEGLLWKGRILVQQNLLSSATEVFTALLEEKGTSPFLRTRVLLQLTEAHTAAGQLFLGMQRADEALSEAESHHWRHLTALARLTKANLLMLMKKEAGTGLDLVHQSMLSIFSSGCQLDVARTYVLKARLLLARNATLEDATQRKAALSEAAVLLESAATMLASFEATDRLKTVYYLLARIYNELSNCELRNRCAQHFRHLDQEHGSIHPIPFVF